MRHLTLTLLITFTILGQSSYAMSIFEDTSNINKIDYTNINKLINHLVKHLPLDIPFHNFLSNHGLNNFFDKESEEIRDILIYNYCKNILLYFKSEYFILEEVDVQFLRNYDFIPIEGGKKIKSTCFSMSNDHSPPFELTISTEGTDAQETRLFPFPYEITTVYDIIEYKPLSFFIISHSINQHSSCYISIWNKKTQRVCQRIILPDNKRGKKLLIHKEGKRISLLCEVMNKNDHITQSCDYYSYQYGFNYHKFSTEQLFLIAKLSQDISVNSLDIDHITEEKYVHANIPINHHSWLTIFDTLPKKIQLLLRYISKKKEENIQREAKIEETLNSTKLKSPIKSSPSLSYNAIGSLRENMRRRASSLELPSIHKNFSPRSHLPGNMIHTSRSFE